MLEEPGSCEVQEIPPPEVETYADDAVEQIEQPIVEAPLVEPAVKPAILPDASKLCNEDMTLQEPFAEPIGSPTPKEEVSPYAAEEAACLEIIRDLCSPTVSYSLSSDQWAHRKEGLELIQKYIDRCGSKLDEMSNAEIVDEFYAIGVILRKFFEDRVAPVYFAAYDCFRALLKVYGSLVSGSRVEDILRSMVIPLLTAMGGEATGTNRRTQKEACRCVLRVARLTHLDGLGVVVPLLTSTSIPLRPRLALLKLLMQEFRIEDSSSGNNTSSSITTELVLSICQPALANSDDKVRKAAVDNIGIAYGMVGKAIKMHITDVKPATLKVLEKKFAEIDGTDVPSESAPKEEGVSLKKSRSKKISRKGSKGGENIRNLAPVMLSKSDSFAKGSFGRANSGANTSFGYGGMDCEIYVKEKKPVQQERKRDSPQQNSPSPEAWTKQEAPVTGSLEGVNRQLFVDAFVGDAPSAADEDAYGHGGSSMREKMKKGSVTTSRGNSTPGHPNQGTLDSRFVISESIC